MTWLGEFVHLFSFGVLAPVLAREPRARSATSRKLTGNTAPKQALRSGSALLMCGDGGARGAMEVKKVTCAQLLLAAGFF